MAGTVATQPPTQSRFSRHAFQRGQSATPATLHRSTLALSPVPGVDSPVTMRPFPSLLLLSLGLLSTLAALDPPAAIVAIPTGAGTQQYGFDCGGAAVVIGPGQALTLAEALPTDGDEVTLSVAGREVTATVTKRGTTTGAVLLNFPADAITAAPLVLADSTTLRLGDVVWSAGNSYGVLEQDGVVALSRGVVSGLYPLPADSPPVRGRAGRIMGTYRGAVIETDAAINDGNQGGALLDDAGHLIGLVTFAQTRERRLGTAIPIQLICADLGLSAPTVTVDGGKGVERQLAEHAAQVATSVVLVYFERPKGPGNPPASPRPRAITDDVPPYQRERLQNDWNRYYHEQQIFYTDQPVSAIVVGDDVLLTSASNLHGDAQRGHVLTEVGPIDCTVVAIHRPLDLVLLRTSQRLPLPKIPWSEANDHATGDAVAVLGRHRSGAGFTMTTGVISALDRRLSQGEFALAQTDAMANYGNLGGPVMDRQGEVIGLMVLLGPAGPGPWYINSGVAPFVDVAAIRKALPGLMAGTTVDQGRIIGLGISFDRESMRILRVVDGAGAATAGVQPGDVVQAIDGQTVRKPEDVSRILVRHRAGDTVALRVARAGADVQINVVLQPFGDE